MKWTVAPMEVTGRAGSYTPTSNDVLFQSCDAVNALTGRKQNTTYGRWCYNKTELAM